MSLFFLEADIWIEHDSLIIQKEEIIITVYSSGKVSMGMIKNESEARKVLEELRNTINEAIKKELFQLQEKSSR